MTGRQLLSGTSMATPHVAGVMAALLHLKPSPTSDQARDMILDPASYDVVSDARAKSTSTGGHTLYAIATDNANNVGTSAGVGITIPPPPPPPPSFSTFTLAPVNPARKSTATISATVSSSVTRVEFYINGSLVSNDTSTPFSYSWKVPAAMGKTYVLSARAYNAAGQFDTSSTITVSPR